MAATSVTTTFTPLHDRILVRRLEDTETVRGGIIIPDSAKEKPQEGEVISVGKGKSNDEGRVFPLDVKAGDRVLVKRLEEQETKRGGIIIPDSAKEKPQHAEVVAVGKGKLLEDGNRAVPDVKAGDKILFGKYSGSDIRIDGDEYLVLREDEILGVFANE